MDKKGSSHLAPPLFLAGRQVINHLAKPRIQDGHFDDWAAAISAAAQFPNVYCKLYAILCPGSKRGERTRSLRLCR